MWYSILYARWQCLETQPQMGFPSIQLLSHRIKVPWRIVILHIFAAMVLLHVDSRRHVIFAPFDFDM